MKYHLNTAGGLGPGGAGGGGRGWITVSAVTLVLHSLSSAAVVQISQRKMIFFFFKSVLLYSQNEPRHKQKHISQDAVLKKKTECSLCTFKKQRKTIN